MKTRENKAMRFASVLLVLTLLATSLTAGTFAKYATDAKGEGKARVAKFGVDVSVDTSQLFGEQYNKTGIVSTGDQNITVDANDTSNVVAPGTNGFMTFTIKGNPETSVKLEVKMTGSDENSDIKEVMLAAGTYKNGENGEPVTVGNGGYYPVKWTLEKTGEDQALLSDVKLSAIVEKLNGVEFNKIVEPNTLNTIEGTYKLSWKWDFENKKVGATDTEKQATDGADTILGDLAVEAKEIEKQNEETQQFDKIGENDYCLNEEFKLTISVTQED